MTEQEAQALIARMSPFERQLFIRQMMQSQQQQQQQPQQQQGGGVGAMDIYKIGKQLFGGGGSGGAGGEFIGPQLPVAGDASFIGPTQPGMLSQMGSGVSQGFSGLGSSGTAAQYAGPAALAAAGTYGLYNLGNAVHKGQVKDNRKGYARGVSQGAASGAAIGTAIAPGIGTLIGGGIGAIAGGVSPLFSHEGTKEAQRRKWGELEANGVIVPKGLSTADQKAAGNTAKNWTFEGARQKLISGENPDEFVGVLGNLETFGNDWFGKYNDAQRRAFAKKAAEANLYYSSKGDIFIKDKDRANAFMSEIMGGGAPSTQSPVTQAPFRTLPGTLDPGRYGPVDVQAVNNIGNQLGLKSVVTSRGDTAMVDAGTAKRWRELKGKK